MRLILTSNGFPSANPSLEEVFRRFLDEAPSKVCWYLPTAPLRDGWSERQARAQMARLGSTYGMRMEWIDPEYTKGDRLRDAVTALKPGVIYAEMGNTYNICHHLHNSGGDRLVTELVSAGAVYVGASAGSIMAGRTIQTACTPLPSLLL